MADPVLRCIDLLREAVVTLDTWADVAPAVSLRSDIRKALSAFDDYAPRLESWREEITHPNSRLLFKRMMERAGIVVGEDDIASALLKVAALKTA